MLTPEMQDIIKRWGNPDDGNPDTFLFKYARETEDEFAISNIVRRVTHRCNIALAKIAQVVGVPRFTTYSARHSYATVHKTQRNEHCLHIREFGAFKPCHHGELPRQFRAGGADKECAVINQIRLSHAEQENQNSED